MDIASCCVRRVRARCAFCVRVLSLARWLSGVYLLYASWSCTALAVCVAAATRRRLPWACVRWHLNGLRWLCCALFLRLVFVIFFHLICAEWGTKNGRDILVERQALAISRIIARHSAGEHASPRSALYRADARDRHYLLMWASWLPRSLHCRCAAKAWRHSCQRYLAARHDHINLPRALLCGLA